MVDNDDTICVYTVLHLPDELLGLSHSFLGDGDFGFIAPVCKRFKTVYLAYVNDETITTDERATSSISRATRTYSGHAGDNTLQLALFWDCVARHGRVGVMEWAHQQGYSRAWNTRYDYYRSIDVKTCESAADN